ncbi:armadillo-type protein [Mycena rosella]|uniref:Armadillo-type protein n=1 Tax=Mycena rosella TaxID=1033263 RepID=A0AAD7H1F8_MYCRO|nr:armadillo-type protein [Mycena rosella]
MKSSMLTQPPQSSDEHTRRAPTNTGGGHSHPQHIAMPPPNAMFNLTALSSSSPSRALNDPFASPLDSPALEMYHTAPSTPITSPLIEVPSYTMTQPRVSEPSIGNLHIAIPAGAPNNNTSPDLQVEEAFPTGEIPIDLVDDEGLSALEKIYLFARSQSVYHRLYIVHALPSFLQQVTPQEAIEYVLPLVPCLAMDEDEKVKEALVAELVPVIWWFFTHCQIIPDDLGVEETVYSSSTSTISVQAFTPILGTLLLSPNSKVGGAARYVVVNILSRMRKLDQRESGSYVPSPPPLGSLIDSDSEEEEEALEDIPVGLFGPEERLMFEQELLQQVVIGMGRLDVDAEDDVEMFESHTGQGHADDNWTRHSGQGAIQVASVDEQVHGEDAVVSPQEPEKPEGVLPVTETVNPYFPVLPSYSIPSPGSSNSSTPSSATDTSSSSSSPSIAPETLNAAGSAPSLISSYAMDFSLMNLASQPEIVQPPLGDEVSATRTSNLPSAQRSPSTESPASSPQRNMFQMSSGASSDAGTDENGADGTYDGEGDQASVGRLSSMSLMAAVAANGCLDDNTKHAFVKEVERVGHDPVYWVRREASYALGALAKVVPDEVVACSLIPLFDTLRRDSQWQVRHSALFALPAILSRLPPSQRRALALDTILPLAIDQLPSVRSGALESLGEVLFTFREDVDGPPEELVQLFLGRREDRRVRDGQQAAHDRDQVLSSLFGRPTPKRSAASRLDSPLTSFYTDPARPLICAFNYPAVALTLGRHRWGELREAYLEIADNRELAVRRSLAASLGELAKIIGEDNAERDLMGVWWDAVRSDEGEVREKLLECVEVFVAALGKEPRIAVVGGLLTVWREGIFRGWRERKAVAKALTGLAKLVGSDVSGTLRDLLRMALEDGVAAVREAAMLALPHLWSMFTDQEAVLANLRKDLRTLSQSAAFRQRMTFVACLQALLIGAADGRSLITSEDGLWTAVFPLADDSVVGVRIGVARLARVASERSQNSHQRVSGALLDLVRHLSLDSSHDVQSYVLDFLNPAAPGRDATSAEVLETQLPRHPKFATFSRPPPPPSPHALSGSSRPPDTGKDEISRRMTRSANADTEVADINSNSPLMSGVRRAIPPEEVGFSLGRDNPTEFRTSPSDSKKAIAVPG